METMRLGYNWSFFNEEVYLVLLMLSIYAALEFGVFATFSKEIIKSSKWLPMYVIYNIIYSVAVTTLTFMPIVIFYGTVSIRMYLLVLIVHFLFRHVFETDYIEISGAAKIRFITSCILVPAVIIFAGYISCIVGMW